MPGADIATLSKAQLFARLAQGLAGGVTVLTPNQRLAQALAREFDAAQAAQGRSAWESADILPYAAFVGRCYEDALYSEIGSGLPILLTPAQAHALWEDIIRRSDAGGALLALPETAALAADAWNTAHAWRLLGSLRAGELNEDATTFRDWCATYSLRCERERHTDTALLPDLIAAQLSGAALRKPKLLALYGFDIMTPQQRALFDALRSAGTEVVVSTPERREASVLRFACVDAREEIGRAAAWARARLEADPEATIGIVVPDLAQQRKVLMRTFRAVMAPASILSGAREEPLPFNVSLGAALTTYPLVQAACLILELAGREIEFGRASLLLRSPFIAAGESEAAGRARLDLELRRRAEPSITLDRLLATIDTINAAGAGAHAPELAQRLRRLAEFRKSDLFAARAPSAWAKAITAALQLMGFPDKGRSLDSAEYQTLKKWHEVVAGFALLDRVHAKMGYGEAVVRLKRLAAETLFQPEAPQAPVQILGVLESAGIAFDHLWVMGLTDDAWPIHPRPNPFLPLDAQRQAQVPEASIEATLALDGAITRGWLGAAGEVVLSYARGRRREEASAEPAAARSAARRAGAAGVSAPSRPDPCRREHRSYRGRRRTAARGGGTAAHRGRSALRRHGGDHRPGRLPVPRVRAAPPRREIPRSAARRARCDGARHPRASRARERLGPAQDQDPARCDRRRRTRSAARAGGGRRGDAREARPPGDARRALRRSREGAPGAPRARPGWKWNAKRAAMTLSVAAVEDKRSIVIGPLTLRGKLDRVDELEDGRRLVIDYKSTAAPASAWLGERPDEPQLPLYLVTTEPDAVAIAFAQVKAGDMKFAALAADETLLPVRKSLPDIGWDAQVGEWRRVLAQLATRFAAGEAAVEPKNPPTTCRNCDAQPLCRIHERLGAPVSDQVGDDES